jgi:hypothetical protein
MHSVSLELCVCTERDCHQCLSRKSSCSMKMQQIQGESKAKDADSSSDCIMDGSREICQMDDFSYLIYFESAHLLFGKQI